MAAKMYERILLATDLLTDTEAVINKVKELSAAFGVSISVVHAVEPLPGYGYAAMVNIDEIEIQIMEQAEKDFKDFVVRCEAHFKVDSKALVVGPAVSVVIDKAKEMKADLIVVGSHGKHGLELLLGSTATGVMHHAKCDVLVVRLRD